MKGVVLTDAFYFILIACIVNFSFFLYRAWDIIYIIYRGLRLLCAFPYLFLFIVTFIFFWQVIFLNGVFPRGLFVRQGIQHVGFL